MPGPAPKDPAQRRRRNATVSTTKLPAEGRRGRSPAWPLSKASTAERKVWAEVWKTPQAVAWERLGWTRTVARYVRFLIRAEDGDVKAASEVRLIEDRIGLTPMSMLRLRWEIATDEVGEHRERREAVRRLKAVDPAAVARS